MSDNTRILVRNARDQDIPEVVEIDTEAFSPYGTAEKPETFRLRLIAFPNGFIILVAANEIAAYGCSQKWLTEREPGLDENSLPTHQPDGRILDAKLPSSAYEYRQWWESEKEGNHVNPRAWANAGWKIENIDFNNKEVKLVRVATGGRGV